MVTDDPGTLSNSAGLVTAALSIIALLVRELSHRGKSVEKLVEAITAMTTANQIGQSAIKHAIEDNTRQTVEHIDLVGAAAQKCSDGLVSQAKDLGIITEVVRTLRSARG